MENDINTLKLIEMASAHLKVQGIQSGIVPMPGTDKSIVIGSPAEVVELMPELRGAIPAAWHNFARAIANMPHGAEANIAGMQSKAAQLLAAEDARAKVLPKDEGAVASVGRQLDFRPSEQYSAWFTVNRSKLRNHSIFTKGAVIWNAARAAHPVAASAGIEGLTDRRILDIFNECPDSISTVGFARAIERALLATQSAKQGAQPSTLDRICDLFGIGALARSESTIMENVRNAIRREECLSAVERTFFMVPAEPDEDFPDEDPGDECLLGWGRTPEQYVEQFRAALKEIGAAPAAPLQTMDDTTRDEAIEAIAAWYEQVGYMFDEGDIADLIRRFKSTGPASTDQKGSDHA